jgi:hypothetical protein
MNRISLSGNVSIQIRQIGLEANLIMSHLSYNVRICISLSSILQKGGIASFSAHPKYVEIHIIE